MPQLIAKRYRVIKEIGRGGMGSVYLVQHENTGEYHALKVLHEQTLLDDETLERFKREMRLPAKIRSEHIARITDADISPELDGAPFLVMELLNGCDLGRILTKFGARSNLEVIWIIGQVAKALDKAHAINVVHRDLKPENIFIHKREDGSIITKVLDFGIAKAKEDIRRTTPAKKRPAGTQRVIGTPLYMSPEQARGPSPDQPPINSSCDIWSIGMVTFELLTGEPYWLADNPMTLMGQIFFGRMRPPSERFPLLPQNFDHWFARSCEREPANRWVSASKQFDALLHALNLTEETARIPTLLTEQVSLLTPLHLEDVAQNEPSLIRIISPQKPQADQTLVEVEKSIDKLLPDNNYASSTTDVDSIPAMLEEMPTEKYDSRRHSQYLKSAPLGAVNLVAAPGSRLAPTAQGRESKAEPIGNVPTPITDLPTEPFDPRKHRIGSAPIILSAEADKELPSHSEPNTLPLAIAQNLTLGSRQAEAIRALPQWLLLLLVFISGLGLGVLLLTVRC